MFIPIGYGFNSGYLLVFFLIPLILGAWASGAAQRRLSKYGRISNSKGLTGSQAAAEMLNFHDVDGVAFRRGGGGQDFFDPRSNSITLSPGFFSQPSISAIAVACHEAGHACQYAQAYAPIKIRAAIVPVVNFASNAWIFILLAGFLFNLAQLYWVAIIVFGLTLLFHLVTLPVEFNASSRAIAYLDTLSLADDEYKACKKILRSCAMTYVVAALISILQFIWVILQQQRRN